MQLFYRPENSIISKSIQSSLALVARLLFVAFFLPAVGGWLALAANGAGAFSLDVRKG